MSFYFQPDTFHITIANCDTEYSIKHYLKIDIGFTMECFFFYLKLTDSVKRKNNIR